MVVKSIFLILNISHSSFANNHNISDPPAEGGRGGGGSYLAPGRTWAQPGHRPTSSLSPGEQISTTLSKLTNTAPLQLLRSSFQPIKERL